MTVATANLNQDLLAEIYGFIRQSGGNPEPAHSEDGYYVDLPAYVGDLWETCKEIVSDKFAFQAYLDAAWDMWSKSPERKAKLSGFATAHKQDKVLETGELAPKRAQVRGQIFGYSATAVLRWMGANGFTFEDAGVVLASFGLAKMSDTTIRIQLTAGKKADPTRGEPAPLTAAQGKKLIELTK
jgi:hypothetical protein